MADLTLKARPTVVATESIARMNYDDQWIVTRHVCEHCNWQGMGRDLNMGHAWVLDASPMSCPNCGHNLVTLSPEEFSGGSTQTGGQAASLLQAATFAADKHRLARRSDAEQSPYINHPLAVSTLLAMEAGVVDTATLCTALLHDTIEDTDTTADELEGEFGPEVRHLVEEVTDNKVLPEDLHARAESAVQARRRGGRQACHATG